jgi:cell division protein FtsB
MSDDDFGDFDGFADDDEIEVFTAEIADSTDDGHRAGGAAGPREHSRVRFASRAAIWAVSGSLLAVAAMFVYVFPARAYLAKRADQNRARSELAQINAASSQLETQAKQLQSDDEIERIAREKYNLVLPNERAWAIVPIVTTTTVSPTTTTTAPSSPTP